MKKFNGIIKSLILVIIAIATQFIVFTGTALFFAYYHQDFIQGFEFARRFFQEQIYVLLIINWSLAFMVYRILGYEFKLNTPKPFMGKILGASIILGVGINLLTNRILSLLPLGEGHFQSVYSFITDGGFILGVIVIGLIGPVFEEILFRQFIYDELIGATPFFAIIIQGLLFGIYHFNWIQLVYATMVGIIFGVLVYWTNNLLASISTHCVINLLSFVFARFNINIGSMHLSLIIIVSLGLISLGLYEFSLLRNEMARS
jgi:membrane protease YdiL (CAAX protease family)